MSMAGLSPGSRQAGRLVLPIALTALVLLAGAVALSRTTVGAPHVTTVPVAGSSLSAVTRTPASDRAMTRLARAITAEATTAYAGRRYVSLSATSSERSAVVDLLHQPGRGYRVTVEPTTSTVGGTTVEADGSSAILGPSDAEQLRVLAEHYTARVLPGTTVTGRPTDLIELRGTAGRVAARYWLDTRTALPLQRVVLDEKGRVEQASAYTSLTMGMGAEAAYAALGGDRPAGVSPTGASMPTSNVLGVADVVTMRQEGWSLPDVVGERGLQLVSAMMVHDSPPALHLRYTDGLCTVSVFEERGRLDAADLRGWYPATRSGVTVRVASGPPEQAVWSAAGRVYTAVSEDPDAVDDAISGLPHVTVDDGAGSRLLRGVTRLGRWVDPTG